MGTNIQLCLQVEQALLEGFVERIPGKDIGDVIRLLGLTAEQILDYHAWAAPRNTQERLDDALALRDAADERKLNE